MKNILVPGLVAKSLKPLGDSINGLLLASVFISDLRYRTFLEVDNLVDRVEIDLLDW